MILIPSLPHNKTITNGFSTIPLSLHSQVKCDVISMDVDEDGNILKKQELINEEGKAIRDVSRNRLQRLGALYSETENLSSPIHRTEAKFCAESSSTEALCDRETPRPAKNKSSKLAALADSINKWECDVSAENKKPTTTAINKAKPGTSAMRTPTKATSYKTTTQAVLKTPERKPHQNNQNSSPTVVGAQSKGAIKKTTVIAAGSSTATGTSPKPKSLKWDKSVMDALESQGFQKRQSQGGSVTLSYNKDPAHDSSSDREKENRMNETVSNKKMALSSNKDLGMKNSPKKLNLATAPGTPKVGNNSRQSIAANRKDPAELSLRDRLAIFEKNKGEAVMPKAPLAQPIPANKANPGSNNLSGRCGGGGYGGPAPPAAKTPEKKQMVPVNLPKATSDAPGQGIQSTISALMQGGATISGQAIKESVKKQRAQEMDVLLNRFNNRQQMEETTEDDDEEQDDDDCDSSEVEYKIPAPPPPPPAHYSAGGSQKRRSGDKKEEGPKRVKTQAVQHNRLYPQLSDVDDTSSSEQNYTTATVSEDNNKDEDYDYR